MTVDHSTHLTVVSVLPQLLDTNGDAANARVLAQRARWAGLTARIVPVGSIADLPPHADLVVIGSGTDTDLAGARDALRPLTGALTSWLAGGVPLLAVGTGWELLSEGVDLAGGGTLAGLGLVPGRATPLKARATDDLIVEADGLRLSGFENHHRGYTGAPVPLGSVSHGTGNGGGTEGLVHGSFVGTHLHGPFLARNPTMADRMLRQAGGSRGLTVGSGRHADAVDDIARAARNQVAVRLGLTVE